jgi:signal transduction histidine kinase
MAKRPVMARARLQELQAAVEIELRRQVARELHDGVAQTLTAMLIELENFKTQQVGWDDVLRQLDTIQDSTRHVLQNLRQLLYDLRGEQPRGDRFTESVGILTSRFAERTGIMATVTVDPGWPEETAQAASFNLFRIVEEALVNVLRHSGARSVDVALHGSGGVVWIQVKDDGRGFESDFNEPGMGTIGMRERALILGGTVEIDSRPGEGTTVRASFPRQLVAALPRPERMSYVVAAPSEPEPLAEAVPV